MARVLLVNPGVASSALFGRAHVDSAVGVPVGLLCVAAALERRGVEVAIVDCLVGRDVVTRREGSRIVRTAPTETLERAIAQARPDLLGISARFFTQERDALRIARIAKRWSRQVLVAVGGAHAASQADLLLGHAAIDLVALGEGEPSAAGLVGVIRDGRPLAEVAGIAYRDQAGATRRTPTVLVVDLDELPLPAYHLLDMRRYLALHREGVHSRDRDVQQDVSVVTSRGCVHRCSFCAVHRTMGRRWRAQSPRTVVRHLELLARTYGARHVHFEDDDLLHDMARFDPIAAACAQLGLTWDAPNGIRVDRRLTEDRLGELRRRGCRSLHIGVESGNEQVLRESIQKPLQLAEVNELAQRCRRVGIPLRAFYVLGLPGDTVTSMKETVAFALELLRAHGVEPINLIATPFPGTRMHQQCVEGGLLARVVNAETLTDSVEPEGHSLIRTADFSPSDVEGLSRELSSRAYRIMLRRGLRHPLRTVRRVGTVPWALKAARRLLRW